ncbi:MAG: hypothetical protein ACKVZJ_03945 [Phycisphaerales bacterium]
MSTTTTPTSVPAPAPASATTLQGLIATREDEAALIAALEQAFDYRGDVTLTLTSGTAVTGYIFDRRSAGTLAGSVVRLLPADGGGKVSVAYSEIAKLEFTGKDTAHGKTFENWMKRYVEARQKGQKAGIESEELG